MGFPAVSARDILPAVGPSGAPEQAARMFDFILGVLAGELTPSYPLLANLTALGIPAGGAGYTIVRYLGNHNDASFRRGALLRCPQLDDLDTYSTYVYISCQTNIVSNPDLQAGYVAFGKIYDVNPFDSWTSWSSQLVSHGLWTQNVPSTTQISLWPQNGQPQYLGITTGASVPEYSEAAATSLAGYLIFTGNQAYDIMGVASAYGGTFINLPGTVADGRAYTFSREFDYVRVRREIQIEGSLDSGSWATGLDLGNITPVSVANPHALVIEVEGQTFNIDFTDFSGAGTYLYNARKFCTAINQAGRGFFEAVEVETPLGDELKVAIRIPPTRPPVGEYSLDRPRIRILHQDDALSALGLTFAVEIPSYFDPVTGGALTPISPTVFQGAAGLSGFPIYVRPGYRIYNRTQDEYATIVGFGTGALQDDQVVIDPPQAGWIGTDDYLLLPTADHASGVGAHAGVWQATVESDPTIHVVDGASVTLMLSDLWGEAFRHIQVNQEVQIANNGHAAVITASNVVGSNWKRGDRFECTVGSGLGTQGIVRDVKQAGGTFTDADQMVIEIIRGASGNATPYKVAPLAVGNTIARLDPVTGSPTATTLDLSALDHSDPVPCSDAAALGTRELGNLGLARVTAVVQRPNAATGDYRTRVVLNLAGVNVNPNLILFPSFFVGLRPKYWMARQYNFALGTSGFARMAPGVFDSLSLQQPGTTTEVDQTVLNQRSQMLAAPKPVRDPDYQTGTLGSQLHEVLTRGMGSGSDRLGPFAHLISVSARGNLGSPNNYDRLQMCGNTNMPWLAFETDSDADTGAGNSTVPAHWLLLGPGLNIQFP